MFKRILMLLTVSFQLSVIGFLNNESILPDKTSICIVEVCYTETVISNGRTFIYEYACDGTLINIIEVFN